MDNNTYQTDTPSAYDRPPTSDSEPANAKKAGMNDLKKILLLVLISAIALFALFYSTGFNRCPDGHTWQAATCTDPEICSVCKAKQGSPLGHTWSNATCTQGKFCYVCGADDGKPLGHQWKNATCTQAQTCSRCSATSGDPLGHQWKDATASTPKTCKTCGITTGGVNKADPVYLVDLPYYQKYGKLWIWSSKQPTSRYDMKADYLDSLKDMNTPGYTPAPVKDNRGNVYQNAFHLDGYDNEIYTISFRLNGEYVLFTGTCGFPGETLSARSSDPSRYKYFEVYGDGTLLYRSADMSVYANPVPFSVNITGVNVLTIQYPDIIGANEIATIFDGKLS